MGRLFEELKRRNVVRVGIAYIVGGGLMIELIDTIAPRLGMPDWVPTFVIIAILIGLPIALVFSWSYELTPEGLKTTSEVDADASITHSTGRRLDFAIIGMLVLALGYFVWERTSGPGSTIEAPGSISIAVLPFTDMSAAQDQEYFGDGIAEEILNTLVRIENLRVTSRTSSFAFKGANLSLPEIAGRLGVTHVVEGSVRSAGNQIRVTAQLIEVATDHHLWSESYDRELDDIFAIQDDISRSITTALKVRLIGAAVQTVRPLTDNVEAYKLYLQGHHLLLQRGAVNLEAAADRFQEAVALDAKFALAWADLGISYALVPYYSRAVDRRVYLARAEPPISKALVLQPDLAQAWAGRAFVAFQSERGLEALQAIEHSVELDPNNETSWLWWGIILGSDGYIEEAIPKLERAVELAPTTGINVAWLGLLYSQSGQLEEARRLTEQAIMLGWRNSYLIEALINLEAGLSEDLKRSLELLAIREGVPEVELGRYVDAFFDPSLRPAAIPELESALQSGPGLSVFWGSILLDRADGLATYFGSNASNPAGEISYLWSPKLRHLLSEPEMKDFLREYGMVNVWRIRGWPEFCRPLGDDDFECD